MLRRLIMTVVASGAALLTAGIAPAQAATPVYVSLGDSYSAGAGAGSGFDGSDCKHSTLSYSALWAAAHPQYTFQHLACNGAHTTDTNSYSGTSNAELDLDGQIAAMSPNADLVSVTIGGNDVSFADLLVGCLVKSASACKRDADARRPYVQTELKKDLKAAYAAIKNKNPNARIVVLGYPHVFEGDASCNGFSVAEQAAVNSLLDLTVTVTAQAVAETAATGTNITFADVRPAFAGHGACADDEWVNQLVPGGLGLFHPNADGYRYGYLPALTSAAG